MDASSIAVAGDGCTDFSTATGAHAGDAHDYAYAHASTVMQKIAADGALFQCVWHTGQGDVWHLLIGLIMLVGVSIFGWFFWKPQAVEARMLTVERLKAYFHLRPGRGTILKASPRRRAIDGEAGTVNTGGYRQICIDQNLQSAPLGVVLRLRRLAEKSDRPHQWPADDNRLGNLREADFSQNQANAKKRARCRKTRQRRNSAQG